MQTNNLSFSKTRNISIYYLLPLLVGGSIAAIVCLDSFVTYLTVIGEEFEILASFPYLFSALVILACFAIPFCLRSFYRSDQMLLMGTILTICLEGVVLPYTIELYRAFLIISLGFWLFRVLLYREGIFIHNPVLVLNIALFSLIVLSFGNSLSKGASARGIIAVFLQIVVLVFLMLNYIRTRELLLKTIHFIFIAASFTSLAAIAQWLIWWTTGKIYTLSPGGFNIWAVTPFGIYLRASAFFSAANPMGGFLSTSFIWMLYFVLSPSFSRRMRKLYFLALFLSAVAIVLSLSRSSCIAIALALVILPYLKKPLLWLHYTLVLILLVVLGLATGLFSSLLKFVGSFEPGSAQARVILTERSIEIFLDRPLTGSGIYAFEAYPGIQLEPGQTTVHNAILHVFSECGLAAGLLYLFIFFLVFIRLIRGAMVAQQAQDKAIMKAMLLSFVVLFFEMQFDIFTFFPNTWMYVAVYESAILLLGKREAKPESNVLRRNVI